jgi:hypothetical protein
VETEVECKLVEINNLINGTIKKKNFVRVGSKNEIE